ncbi:hypothetical protein DAPPUDRAFT_305972 [Daphnia pulex]|uniref:Uncharacterized protein n=1 Tax=Daphnia pulex TaxID=6669 RepID=E9GU35_DAPPU|nr:hypothetical protein DAPPUDRAFT_305972 [Daphnia pulex]|eukprot:EFX76968.1 hypothetical protein DAPPUDRAFT_305972 [Daphnia pulex]
MLNSSFSIDIIPQNFGLSYISRRRKKNNNKKGPPFLWVFKRKSLTVNMKKNCQNGLVSLSPFAFYLIKTPQNTFPFFFFPDFVGSGAVGERLWKKRKYAL